jgi:hypothetical protein
MWRLQRLARQTVLEIQRPLEIHTAVLAPAALSLAALDSIC